MIQYLRLFLLSSAFLISGLFYSCSSKEEQDDSVDQMLVRLAEIEVDEAYLSEYLAILNDEARESMAKEDGVIAIFPMQLKDKTTSVRILEIYKDQASYEAHLQSAHFLFYKEGTKEMVKSLKLIEHQVVDKAAMSGIFKKIK